MAPVGRILWLFPDTAEFGEELPLSGHVVALPADTIILKAVYLSRREVAEGALANVRGRLGNEPVHVLRLVPSTDGPPSRSALVYTRTQPFQALRVRDWRLPMGERGGSYHANGIIYQSIAAGTSYGWESEAASGNPGYFVTGFSGETALWRVARVEGDAFDRQFVTLFPVRLAFPLAAANFEGVAEPLRGFLQQHYDALRSAAAANLHIDVVNRASSLAEGVIEYCLVLAGRRVPNSLYDRLEEVKKALDDPTRPPVFPLT